MKQNMKQYTPLNREKMRLPHVNGYQTLFWLLLCVAAGCKKQAAIEIIDTVKEQRIQHIKSWMTAQKTARKASKKTTVLPPLTAQWDLLKYDHTTRCSSIPVSVKSSFVNTVQPVTAWLLATENTDGSVNNCSYAVFIPDAKKMPANDMQQLRDMQPTGATIIPHNYSGALLEYDMSGAVTQSSTYSNGKLLVNNMARLSSKSEVNTNSPLPSNVAPVGGGSNCEGGVNVCTDWYWQTWVNGQLVSEEYVFTTCACSATGGGGGAVGIDPASESGKQAIFDAFVNMGRAVNGAVTTIDGPETIDEWHKRYSWKVYQAGIWLLLSYERAVWKKVIHTNGKALWEFKSFVHDRIVAVGTNVGGTRTFTDVGATINMLPYSVNERLDFVVEHSALGLTLAKPENATQTFRIPLQPVFEN